MEKIKLTGRIVTPDDSEYEQARINNNLSIPKFPSKIVFCQNTEDVLNALRWVRENRTPFRMRSGRHSYENFSLVNDGLIIDVSEMDEIIINGKEMTAKIEAGANLGHVYNKLWEYGMTVPAGTESSVGVIGLTLGGGIGMLTRLFGLTCDNLIEIEMVRASGHRGAELIKANKNHNSDLFWACCGGGGGNFGIVTSLTFKLHRISKVSVFSVTWGWDDFEAAFNAWQNWAPNTDERLTSQIELKSKEANQIIAQGEFVGPSSKLKELLRPLTTIGSPTSVWVKEVPYIEAVRFFDVPSGNRPALRKRSGSFLEKPFPPKAILTMKQFLANAPNENSGIWHQSLGGAAGRIAPNETAFYYRDAIIAQEYLATWNNSVEERQNIRWIEELKRALSRYTTGDYVNFPDRYIKDWPTAYYGDNFKRLREVKTEYDSFNLFNFPQSIPPFKKWF
ncbi:dehydrogenase [Domibacillus aminovorans]|uniref:Dehydrogenase n=1 Tax=Domibacillus aminovorans TaxID=29332 RepID=A0A177KY90_9BACI|nr:FAD-binding oxidoreductase [Domibacillus aminovorans]OAH57974.1 dehydrogenase [Domibacillus aminovorans]